jgi:uncharacterized OsmC-like protein
MLTVMGIKALGLQADITNATAEITKHMTADPRRISRIEVRVKLPASVSERDRKVLENTARNCPVILSLSDSIVKDLEFQWVL